MRRREDVKAQMSKLEDVLKRRITQTWRRGGLELHQSIGTDAEKYTENETSIRTVANSWMCRSEVERLKNGVEKPKGGGCEARRIRGMKALVRRIAGEGWIEGRKAYRSKSKT